jgi:hypothetical protein
VLWSSRSRTADALRRARADLLACRARGAPSPARRDEDSEHHLEDRKLLPRSYVVPGGWTSTAPHATARPPVVVSTLGMLETRVLLVLLGEGLSHQSLVALLGFRVDRGTAHQTFSRCGSRPPARTCSRGSSPALRTTLVRGPPPGPAVPGGWARSPCLVAMVAAAAALAVLPVRADGSWAFHGFGDRPPSNRTAAAALRLRRCVSVRI